MTQAAPDSGDPPCPAHPQNCDPRLPDVASGPGAISGPSLPLWLWVKGCTVHGKPERQPCPALVWVP